MKRWNIHEIHEMPWCPAVIRDGMTDFLGFVAVSSRMRDPFYQIVARHLLRHHEDAIVELCAGNGFASCEMMQAMRKYMGKHAFRLTISDLYFSDRWARLMRKFPDGDFRAEQGSATWMMQKHHGTFVMLASLHHFSPEEIRALLQEAARNNCAFFSFDYFQRGRCFEWLLPFAAMIFFFLVSPWLYPFSWKRLFLTYVIPVLLPVVAIDTWLSHRRSHTNLELNRLAEQMDLPDLRIRARTIPLWHGIAKTQCFYAIPSKKTEKSQKRLDKSAHGMDIITSQNQKES